MKFIKAGTEYINLDNVTHFDVDMRYHYAKNEMRPAVHIYFTSGGTGEDSTALILYGSDRDEFLKKIEALEVGVSKKSTDEQSADALMRIADAFGDQHTDTAAPSEIGEVGSVLENLDFIARMMLRVADKLGWLKEVGVK
jgi:hypothetical protein